MSHTTQAGRSAQITALTQTNTAHYCFGFFFPPPAEDCLQVNRSKSRYLTHRIHRSRQETQLSRKKGSSFLCTQKWLITLNCSFCRLHNPRFNLFQLYISIFLFLWKGHSFLRSPGKASPSLCFKKSNYSTLQAFMCS